MPADTESKEALGALEDLVRAAESIKSVAERERSQWRREDIGAVKEAREAYLRATEKLKQLTRTAGQPNFAAPSSPEAELRELQQERDSLKQQVAQRQVQLKELLGVSREMLSTMEKWDQWELPSEQPVASTPLEDDKQARPESELSSLDMD